MLKFELTASDIDKHAQDLIGFHERFRSFFPLLERAM